ncbi:MAG: TauD/TfdA family dioxygenase [Novosphingobium sp.]|nr:TauD/TfdA family dioxygenase [Novosphingobium sp.]
MPTQLAEKQNVSVAPMGGALGARVDGIDLAQPVDAELVASLRDAFLEYGVLLFPGQSHISPEQQIAFARLWGEIILTPAPDACHPDYPEILVLDTKGEKPVTDLWHSDITMEPVPPLGSFLLARTVPVGGDTIFANQYLAYDALSDGLKQALEGLRAWHTGDVFASQGGYDADALPRSLHPVIRTHPETGRKALFVNTVYTTCFEGMTNEESRGLLEYLCNHAVQPNFTFRHQWRPGDMLMWDNRCLQHFGVADYGSQPRTMHRVTIKGDKPV